jgi:hypothetical protein
MQIGAEEPIMLQLLVRTLPQDLVDASGRRAGETQPPRRNRALIIPGEALRGGRAGILATLGRFARADARMHLGPSESLIRQDRDERGFQAIKPIGSVDRRFAAANIPARAGSARLLTV